MSFRYAVRTGWITARPHATCSLLFALLSVALPAHATDLSERSRHKSAVEAERADLRQKLNNLKRDISRTESAQDSALSTLAASEEAISDANRALRELAEEQRQAEEKLRRLSQEELKLAAVVEERRQRLAQLLREQYIAGNEDRVKLLLSGDNPNRINRDLQYMGYISQAQAKLIDSLRTSLAAVENNKIEAKSAREALVEIEQEERVHKATLETEKQRHAKLASQLSAKLAAQRQEAGRLQRDEERLSGLVEQLATLIEEQKKLDAQAQEKRRQQLAHARAGQEKKRIQPPVAAKMPNPDAIDDVEAPPAPRTRELMGDNSSADSAFASLRGRLKWPVQGTLAAKYGSKRAEGPNWKGWFIRAAEGSEVKAVAGGKVIFAEWLRGFGNLMIIDHGSQYLTIYGNNQALYKHAGDTVKAGEAIASAGNSGGNEQSGLYFEMRHQGRAFDPLGWVTIR